VRWLPPSDAQRLAFFNYLRDRAERCLAPPSKSVLLQLAAWRVLSQTYRKENKSRSSS